MVKKRALVSCGICLVLSPVPTASFTFYNSGPSSTHAVRRRLNEISVDGYHQQKVHRRRRSRATLSQESIDEGSAKATSVGGPLGVLGNAADDDKARINYLISYLSMAPPNEWSPDVLQGSTPLLLKGGSSLFRQVMKSRMAESLESEARDALEKVNSFLLGYLQQERRRASRTKIQEILGAAIHSPQALDSTVSALRLSGGIDEDVQEYLASLISTEERRVTPGAPPSQLLKVLRAVKGRLDVELKTSERSEVRILALALRLNSSDDMEAFLKNSFKRLEELEIFVEFVQEGITYLADGGLEVGSNMPVANIEKMKGIHKIAERMRQSHLGR